MFRITFTQTSIHALLLMSCATLGLGCTAAMDSEEDWPQDDYALTDEELAVKCDNPEVLEVKYVAPGDGATFSPGEMLVIQADVKTCRKLKGIRAEIVKVDDPKGVVHKYGLARAERGSNLREKLLKVPRKKDGVYTLTVVVESMIPRMQPDGRTKSVTETVTTIPITFTVETPSSPVGGECVDGQTKPCGSDVGECTAGLQTCTGAKWGACVGSVSAVAETCNSKDDDCDGVVDNDVCQPIPTPTPTTCGGNGLQGKIAVTRVPIAAALWTDKVTIASAASSSGETLIAWSGGSPKVTRYTKVSASGVKGAETALSGHIPVGIAVTPDGAAVVSAGSYAPDPSRPSDTEQRTQLFKMRADGSQAWTSTLLDTAAGDDWFTSGISEEGSSGKVIWTGTNYVVYTAVSRGHTADALLVLDKNGKDLGTGWYWGCSHSVDEQVAWNGRTLGAICGSDELPMEGILYTRPLQRDSKGWLEWHSLLDQPNSQARIKLSEMLPASDGFWIAFVAAPTGMGDVGIMHVNDDGSTSGPTWLTHSPDSRESAPHLVSYSGGMLVAYISKGVRYLQRLKANGEPNGSEEAITNASFRSLDSFFNYPNGDVGWVTGDYYGNRNELQIARLATCP